MRYASESWSAVVGITGLLQRSGGTFMYRRRVKSRLHVLYLGRVSLLDAEEISLFLEGSDPRSWPRLVKYTKNFFEWESVPKNP